MAGSADGASASRDADRTIHVGSASPGGQAASGKMIVERRQRTILSFFRASQGITLSHECSKRILHGSQGVDDLHSPTIALKPYP